MPATHTQITRIHIVHIPLSSLAAPLWACRHCLCSCPTLVARCVRCAWNATKSCREIFQGFQKRTQKKWGKSWKAKNTPRQAADGRWDTDRLNWTDNLPPPAPLPPPLLCVDNLNATFRYKIWAKAAHKSSGKITRGCSCCNGSGGRCPRGTGGDCNTIRGTTMQTHLATHWDVSRAFNYCHFFCSSIFPPFYDTLRGAGSAGEVGKLLPHSSLSSFVALVDVIWHFPDIFII